MTTRRRTRSRQRGRGRVVPLGQTAGGINTTRVVVVSLPLGLAGLSVWSPEGDHTHFVSVRIPQGLHAAIAAHLGAAHAPTIIDGWDSLSCRAPRCPFAAAYLVAPDDLAFAAAGC